MSCSIVHVLYRDGGSRLRVVKLRPQPLSSNCAWEGGKDLGHGLTARGQQLKYRRGCSGPAEPVGSVGS